MLVRQEIEVNLVRKFKRIGYDISLEFSESSMPEGVELDTEGEDLIVEEEKPLGPPTALDVVPSYDSVSYQYGPAGL